MLHKIEQWIDETLKSYATRKVSCECFLPDFNGFYPPEFLSTSFFVVVEKIPRPDFPELRQAGLGRFIDMNMDGITYKNTYFVKKGIESYLPLHFHELVHVLQWRYLGAKGFISRYIDELQQSGYEAAPLEKMAYALQQCYSNKDTVFNVPSYVKKKLKEL